MFRLSAQINILLNQFNLIIDFTKAQKDAEAKIIQLIQCLLRQNYNFLFNVKNNKKGKFTLTMPYVCSQ